MDIFEKRRQRTEWFMHDRFGMFIHWGLYAVPGRGAWVMSDEQIPRQEYEKYFEEWNPSRFDAYAWARAAKKAGMKYAVLTTKHHEGFCLFDSQYTGVCGDGRFKGRNTDAQCQVHAVYGHLFKQQHSGER